MAGNYLNTAILAAALSLGVAAANAQEIDLRTFTSDHVSLQNGATAGVAFTLDTLFGSVIPASASATTSTSVWFVGGVYNRVDLVCYNADGTACLTGNFPDNLAIKLSGHAAGSNVEDHVLYLAGKFGDLSKWSVGAALPLDTLVTQEFAGCDATGHCTQQRTLAGGSIQRRN